MDDHTPRELVALWRQRADFLSQFGDPNPARLWQLAAVELERALKTFGDESLTLAEAARATGYSTDYLSKRLAAGTLPNAGRKHAPRIRRGDLQPKPQGGRGRPVRPVRRKDVTPITKLRRTK